MVNQKKGVTLARMKHEKFKKCEPEMQLLMHKHTRALST